jgi:hypothetical protein
MEYCVLPPLLLVDDPVEDVDMVFSPVEEMRVAVFGLLGGFFLSAFLSSFVNDDDLDFDLCASAIPSFELARFLLLVGPPR